MDAIIDRIDARFNATAAYSISYCLPGVENEEHISREYVASIQQIPAYFTYCVVTPLRQDVLRPDVYHAVTESNTLHEITMCGW